MARKTGGPPQMQFHGSMNVETQGLVDGRRLKIGDAIQFLDGGFIPPRVLYLGKIVKSRIHLVYQFDKRKIVAHQPNLPMWIKAAKKELDLSNRDQAYINYVITTKSIFLINPDSDGKHFDNDHKIEDVSVIRVSTVRNIQKKELEKSAKQLKLTKTAEVYAGLWSHKTLIADSKCQMAINPQNDNPVVCRSWENSRIPLKIIASDGKAYLKHITAKIGPTIVLHKPEMSSSEEAKNSKGRERVFIGDWKIQDIAKKISELRLIDNSQTTNFKIVNQINSPIRKINHTESKLTHQENPTKLNLRDLSRKVPEVKKTLSVPYPKGSKANTERVALKPFAETKKINGSVKIGIATDKPPTQKTSTLTQNTVNKVTNISRNLTETQKTMENKKRRLSAVDQNENQNEISQRVLNGPATKKLQIDPKLFDMSQRAVSLEPNGLFDFNYDEYWDKEIDKHLNDGLEEDLDRFEAEQDRLAVIARKKASEERERLTADEEMKRMQAMRDINAQNPFEDSQDEDDDLPLDKLPSVISNSSPSKENKTVMPEEGSNQSSSSLPEKKSPCPRNACCQLDCYQPKNTKDCLSSYLSVLEHPIQFGWKRNEVQMSDSSKKIVYRAICGREFSADQKDELRDDLWNFGSSLSLNNFCFNTAIKVNSIRTKTEIFREITEQAHLTKDFIKEKMFSTAEKNNRNTENLKRDDNWKLFENNGSLDWARGNEGASLLVAYVNDELQNLKEEKKILNVENPYLGNKWELSDPKCRVQNRVSCTCTDGCKTDKCECKQFNRKWFVEQHGSVENYPKDGLLSGQRLNFDDPEIYDKRIQIWECCENCACQSGGKPRICDNSITQKKFPHPTLIMSCKTNSQTQKLAPRVFLFHSLPAGMFVGCYPIDQKARPKGSCIGSIMAHNYRHRVAPSQKDKNDKPIKCVMFQVNTYDKLWVNAFFLLTEYFCPNDSNQANTITAEGHLNRDESKKYPA